MDNIGDWLYIVLLVIAGVSGLFSSGKKKKRPTTILGQPGTDAQTEHEPTQDKGFWEILQEMQKQEKPQSTVQQPTAKKQMIKKQQVTPYTSQPFLSAESKIPNQINPTTPPMPPVEEESGIMLESTFTDMDELRRAVICSEILNRKY